MYSSIEDVKAVTPGAVGDGTSSNPGIPDDKILLAIQEADSTVDTYIGWRYEIPQDPDEADAVAVAPVRWWSRNIAAFNASLTYLQFKNVEGDEPVRLRYTETMKMLALVRDGKITLALPAAGSSTTVDDGSGGVYNQYEGNLFGPDDFGLAPTVGDVPYHIWPGV